MINFALSNLNSDYVESCCDQIFTLRQIIDNCLTL